MTGGVAILAPAPAAPAPGLGALARGPRGKNEKQGDTPSKGPSWFEKLFGKGGKFNKGENFRIGIGRKGGRSVFRLAGKWVKNLTGRPHLDLLDLGEL